MRFQPSRPQWFLLALGVAALIVAEIIRYRQLSEKSATIIGLIEVLAAIITGLAFGWTILRKTKT